MFLNFNLINLLKETQFSINFTLISVYVPFCKLNILFGIPSDFQYCGMKIWRFPRVFRALGLSVGVIRPVLPKKLNNFLVNIVFRS